MTDTITEYLGVIVTFVGALAWLYRLEARGLATAAEVRRLWAQRKEDMDAAKESRASVDKKMDEMISIQRDQGNDIKQLIREVKK